MQQKHVLPTSQRNCHKTYNRTEVMQNKSSLSLKIILQNTQTLQLFKINFKKKLFTEVIKNAKLEGLGREVLSSIKGGVECKRSK